MVDFSLGQLANTVGTDTANFGLSMARNAQNFMCGLYHDYSTWAIGQAQQGTVGGQFVKGVWDTVCKDSSSGLPPAAPPPAPSNNPRGQGSTCWKVDFRNLANVSGTGYECADTMEIIDSTRNPGLPALRINGVDNSSSTTCYEITVNAVPYDANSSVPSSQYGNCSACWVYTQPPVTSPPANRTTGNTTINYNDGTHITVPLTWVEVDPKLNLKVDVGGVKFNFNVDGVHFDFSGGDGDEITNVSNTVNDISNTVNDMSQNMTDMSNTINNIDKSVHNDSTSINVTYDSPVNDKDKSEINKLAYVEVVISNIPPWSSSQFGDGAPDVLYAGWFEFKKGNYAFPREPIDFEGSIFKAPSGADGYAYTLKNGFEGHTIPVKYS